MDDAVGLLVMFRGCLQQWGGYSFAPLQVRLKELCEFVLLKGHGGSRESRLRPKKSMLTTIMTTRT